MKLDARSVLTLAVTALFLTTVPVAVFAEHHEEPAPGYTVIHFDEVGPGNAMAYEENAEAWVAAFKEAEMGDEWTWRTYSGPNFNYAFLTDIPNYAYMDGNDERSAAMVEAIGKEKVDMLSADGGGSTGHYHELTKDLPEYNYVPEGGPGDVGFVHLATVSVKPGMGEQYKALMTKVTEARKTAGGGLAVFASQIEFGQGSYNFATVAKDRATYYSAPGIGAMLAEVYGPEEAQAMFAEWTQCVTDYETSDWYFEPELSYMPAMHEAEGMMDDKKEMGDGE